jgi:hypothetical protein
MAAEANRYRRRLAAPKRRISEAHFDAHCGILEPLIDWIGQYGRVPEPEEFAGAGPIVAQFGSLTRAFALIRRVTDATAWEQIARRRSEDLLVSMALANFRWRRPPHPRSLSYRGRGGMWFGPRQSALPKDLLRDIVAFFGTYKKGRERAD